MHWKIRLSKSSEVADDSSIELAAAEMADQRSGGQFSPLLRRWSLEAEVAWRRTGLRAIFTATGDEKVRPLEFCTACGYLWKHTVW